MKAILKFAALVLVVTIVFIIASALFPYSEGLKNAQQDANGFALLFILLNKAWLCLAIVYVVKKSTWGNKLLVYSLIGVLLMVHSFMMQIETFYFHSAFPALAYADIFLIFIANGIPIFAGVPLAMYLFRKNADRQNSVQSISLPTIQELTAKLTMIGLVYVCVYFLFGYFVAWQLAELRLFYSGSTEEIGFFAQQIVNWEEYPSIYPFQFFRGVLFGVFILPFVLMFKSNSRVLFTSIFLVYMSTAFPLTIPNALFPESVRWAHFLEMLSSMFVFSIIVWYIYDKVLIPLPRRKRYKKRSSA